MTNQRDSFLEEIAGMTHPLALETIPQIYVVGSMGAGKSSLIHGIHNQLRYTNKGLRIYQRRKIPKEEWRDHKQKYKILRRNATVFPETSTIYTHSAGGIIPLEMHVEGSHPKANKLFDRGTVPDAVVFCLDLLLMTNLLDENMVVRENETGLRSSIFQPFRFKCEPNFNVYVSLLEALDHIAYWKEQDVPILAVGTQYQKLIDRAGKNDSDLLKRLNRRIVQADEEEIPQEIDRWADLCSKVMTAVKEGKLLQLAEEIIKHRKTGEERSHYVTSVPTQAPSLPELFPEIVFADSRHPSRVGVEETAYRIVRLAVPQYEDLRLVSLSNQVKDTARVVKYKTIKDSKTD